MIGTREFIQLFDTAWLKAISNLLASTAHYPVVRRDYGPGRVALPGAGELRASSESSPSRLLRRATFGPFSKQKARDSISRLERTG